MKSVVSLAVLLAICCVVYSQKNIEELSATEILQNDEYFQIYANCILDKGDCSQDAAEVKGRIADAFSDGCKKCSPEQLEELKVIFKFLAEKKSDVWGELKNKLDADGSKANNYANLLQ